MDLVRVLGWGRAERDVGVKAAEGVRWFAETQMRRRADGASRVWLLVLPSGRIKERTPGG
jgi:hypothetical protein